jgi:hypothetical protein
MVDFMKKHFISTVLKLKVYCENSFYRNEYPLIMNRLIDSYNFDGTSDLVFKMESGEIDESPFPFLNTRYPYIYQNIIHYACLKLFKIGVFESSLMEVKQEIVSSEMPDWNNLYVISGIKVEDEGNLISSRERLIRTILKDSSWIVHESNIIVEAELITDPDDLYSSIMDQAIQDNEEVEKVLKVAREDEDMKGGITEYLEDEEWDELNMLVFLTDRSYPLELLHGIFNDFVAEQLVFYYENVVIIFHPATIDYDGLSTDCDWTSYNLFSVLYAYYLSLFCFNYCIGMKGEKNRILSYMDI